MAIATRVVRGPLVAAAQAAIDVPTEDCGATVADVGEYTLLLPAQLVRRFELGAVSPHDVRDVETPDPLWAGHDVTTDAAVGAPEGSAFVARVFSSRAHSVPSS